MPKIFPKYSPIRIGQTITFTDPIVTHVCDIGLGIENRVSVTNTIFLLDRHFRPSLRVKVSDKYVLTSLGKHLNVKKRPVYEGSSIKVDRFVRNGGVG